MGESCNENQVVLQPEVRPFTQQREIGRGGTGKVVEVYDPSVSRTTAMKLVPSAPNMVAGEDLRDQFVEEAQITGQLEHPNIVPVHQFGRLVDGRIFLNMRRIRGTSLLELVESMGDDRKQPTRLHRLLDILIRVCDAIEYAHSRGVVHRDLTPANIMVGDFGEVYVLDWGIATVLSDADDPIELVRSERDRSESSVIGTPEYMAPEQTMGGAYTTRASDVYGLGGLLYFILCARGPHRAATATRSVLLACTNEIPDPRTLDEARGTPKVLQELAMQAMSREPEERPKGAGEFRTAIQAFLRMSYSLPTVEIPAGEVIIAEGDGSESAYIVQSGSCEVWKTVAGDNRMIRKLGPGDVFGELAIFAETPRTASVIAESDVVLMEVRRDVLTDGLGLNTWMGTFVRALADRFQALELERTG